MIVATFNMKNSYSPASSKNWIKRTAATIELIRNKKLDVIGTQELTPRTKEYLEEKLNEFYFIGDARGSAGISDEYNSILLRKEMFELVNSNTYSLSNNIYKKGGRFPLDFFPRICTIVHVINNKDKYLIINTHLDNLFNYNRKLQLEVLSEIIDLEKQDDEDVIVMGDFNMKLTGVLERFRKENKLASTKPINFGSSYRNIDRKEPIDYVFLSSNLETEESSLITDKYNGIFPSDHYPVMVKIKKNK